MGRAAAFEAPGMNLIDWILNLAGIVLWVDWRSGRAARQAVPILSVASAVRPIENRRNRGPGSLVWLIVLLVVRPFFYWSIGSGLGWTPHIDLLAIALPWRSDLLDRMLLYSTFSFGMAFGFYYSALLLLSTLGSGAEASSMTRFVQIQLGWLDRLPWWLKLALPSVWAVLAWAAFAQLIAAAGVMPSIAGARQLWGEGLALGIAALLAWKWVLIALLGLHLLNIYIYLGAHPFWNYVSAAARRLLWPLRFLAAGRVDLSPLAGILLLFLGADYLIRPWAVELFRRFIQ